VLFWRCFLREEYSGSKPGSLSCTRSTTTLRLTAYLVHCCGNIMQARPGSHTRRRGPDHRCVLCERGPRQPSRTCPDQPIDRSLLVCVCKCVFPQLSNNGGVLPPLSLSLSLSPSLLFYGRGEQRSRWLRTRTHPAAHTHTAAPHRRSPSARTVSRESEPRGGFMDKVPGPWGQRGDRTAAAGGRGLVKAPK
jgi:hypothetical protein